MPQETPPNLSQNKQSFFSQYQTEAAFIVTTFAAFALFKSQGLSASLRMYPGGGGGLNVYKYSAQADKYLRRFAIDYHPVWNKTSQSKEYLLHYHRGEKYADIKKHRPWQGW